MIMIEVMLNCPLLLLSGVIAGCMGIMHLQILLPLVLLVPSFKEVLGGGIPHLAQGSTEAPSKLYVELDCTHALFI